MEGVLWPSKPESNDASPGIYVERRATFRSAAEWLAQEQWWMSQSWVEDCVKWKGFVMSTPSSHYCNDWDGLPVDCYSPEAECCVDYEYTPEEEKVVNTIARLREQTMLGGDF